MASTKTKGALISDLLGNPFLIGGGIFLLLTLAVLLPAMTVDEGMWNYIAWVWAKKGISPLAGAVDNKPPGIYIVYAISHLVFGLHFLFPRFLGIAVTVATGLVLYRIGLDLHNKLAGLFAMLFFGLTMGWSVMDPALTAQTETFMVLFSCLAFYILLKTDQTPDKWHYRIGIFLSGLSLGMAVAFKQVALCTALALFLFYLTMGSEQAIGAYRNTWLDFSIALAGMLTATLLLLLPLLMGGTTLSDYWEMNWLLLFKSKINIAGEGVRTTHYLRILQSRLALYLPLLALFLLYRKKMLRRGIPFYGLLTWLALDFFGALAAGYCFGHQLKQLVPPLALVSGISLALFLESRQIHQRPAALAAAIITILALWLPYGPLASYTEVSWPIKFSYNSSHQTLGQWIKKNTRPSDYVYLHCRTNSIQAYAERLSPSRFINALFLDYPGAKDKLIHDLLIKRPRIIVHELSCRLPRELKELLGRSYTRLFDKWGFTVYSMRGNGLYGMKSNKLSRVKGGLPSPSGV